MQKTHYIAVSRCHRIIVVDTLFRATTTKTVTENRIISSLLLIIFELPYHTNFFIKILSKLYNVNLILFSYFFFFHIEFVIIVVVVVVGVVT